jgi:hypothetical protein
MKIGTTRSNALTAAWRAVLSPRRKSQRNQWTAICIPEAWLLAVYSQTVFWKGVPNSSRKDQWRGSAVVLRFGMAKSTSKEPWEKPAPKKASHTHLTTAEKAKAKRSAKKAGRPYPNLVDNMKVAKEKKK